MRGRQYLSTKLEVRWSKLLFFQAPPATEAFIYKDIFYTTTQPGCVYGDFDGANCLRGTGTFRFRRGSFNLNDGSLAYDPKPAR
jgi:hypothetical protein